MSPSRRGRLFVTGALLAFTAPCACASRTPRPPGVVTPAARSAPYDAAWSRMRESLPGDWEATMPTGKTVTESFRLVSNGSALVETYRTGPGKETLTVYHRDGGAIVLTHYCAQGNQPRLRAGSVERDAVVFRFADATNLTSDKAVLSRSVSGLAPRRSSKSRRIASRVAPKT